MRWFLLPLSTFWVGGSCSSSFHEPLMLTFVQYRQYRIALSCRPILVFRGMSALWCSTILNLGLSSQQLHTDNKLLNAANRLNWSFTSHATQNRSFRRRYSQPISWLGTEETNPNTTEASNAGSVGWLEFNGAFNTI